MTKRALVIDDEAAIRAFVREVLEQEGYEVREAPDGHVGALALDEAPDVALVVTDILMPESDGLGLILAVKRLAERTGRAPKVLAISGGGVYGTSDFYLEPAKLLGAAQVLRKPFNEGKLREALQALGSA